MLTDCRLPLLVVLLCLLESGCISVRYGQHGGPLEPTPAVRQPSYIDASYGDPGCGDAVYREDVEVIEVAETPEAVELPRVVDLPPRVEAPPPLADASCLAAKPWHWRIHAALPRFWKVRREPEPPVVAPLIPPRPRFHPVPTRPPFARQVIFESVPLPIPSPHGRLLPEPIDTPPVNDDPREEEMDGAPLETDAGQAPQQLSNELRVASPISPRTPTQSR